MQIKKMIKTNIKTILKKAYIKIQILRLYNYKRDIYNRIKYGKKSPVYAERMWINPHDVIAVDHDRIMELGWGYYSSGKVIQNWPFNDGDYRSIWELPKVLQCIKRYNDNMSWEETGAYDHYRGFRNTKDGMRKYTDKEIFTRHREFDAIFEQIKEEKRLRTISELESNYFREEGGILVHIGPKGELVFSETGSHRLAFALILEIPMIPVQIGVVHKNAIPLIEKYRRKPLSLESETEEIHEI